MNSTDIISEMAKAIQLALGLVVGLGYFLREVHLSSNTVRIREIR